MSLSISHRIGAGFIVMLTILGICGFAGVYGVQQLASSLRFVTGPAWQAGNGGMQSTLNIQGEIYKTQQVLLNEIPLKEGRVSIADYQKKGKQSFNEIKQSGLVDESLLQTANRYLDEYHQHQDSSLTLHQQISDQRRQLVSLTSSILEQIMASEEDTMILMDEHYLDKYKVEKYQDIEGILSEVRTGILSRNYTLQQLFEGVSIKEQVRAMEEQYLILKPTYERLIIMMETQKMDRNVKEISGSFDQIVTLYDQVVKNYLQFLEVKKEAEKSSQQLLETLVVVKNKGEQAIQGEVDNVEGTVSQSNGFIWSALGIGFFAAFVAMGITYMTVVLPIRNVAESLDQIGAGEGDLSVALPEGGAAELQQIAIGFNLFVAKIRGTIEGVAKAVDELGGAATSLRGISTETSEAISSQRQQTEQAVMAITEMTHSTNEIAQSAASAADAASSADRSSQDGQQEVNDMISAIHNQVKQLDDTSKAMEKLAQDSQRIGNVLGVINDIAEQTNLLALNAAIEAARAGDKGRGFAVVADEVRTLASNTQSATTEIQDVIQELQNAAHNAVSSVQNTLDIASSSVNQAEQAGGSLSEITESANTINDMNTQIASAASQQSALAENINRNIQSINQQAIETSDASERINHSMDSLADLADSLQRLVGQFKY